MELRTCARRTMLTVLAVVLSAGLMACNGGERADVTPPEPPPAENGAPPPVDNGDPGNETPPGDDPAAQTDEARALVESRCSGCHELDRVWAATYDREGWDAAVARMEARGLRLSVDERATIIDYLAEN